MSGRIQYVLLLFLILLIVGSVPLQAEYIEAQADRTPWSGYWWPLTSAKHVFGFNGHPSPLEKYDLYTAHSYPGVATSWEESNMYDPDGELWYGYCHAWANAAILEDEPAQGAILDNIYFSVGDKKALLTLVHADDSQEWASTSSDPLNFHLYVLRYLVEQGLSFVADLDASSEVWSYPIYKVEMNLTSGESADQFQTTIYYAGDLEVSPDFVGTKTFTQTYTYTLNKDSDGSYISGEWTGASKDNHPDTLWYPLSQKALNPYLDYSTVKTIAQSNATGLENLASPVPGHYLLLMSANSTVSIEYNYLANEQLRFSLAMDSQSKETSGLQATFSWQGGQEEKTINTALSTFTVNDDQNGTAQLLLQAAGNGSQVVNLYLDSTLENTSYLVNLPSNYYWVGLAVQNKNLDKTANIRCYYLGKDNLAVHKGGLGVTIDPGGQLLSLLDYNCTPDYARAGSVQCLKITSDQDFGMVMLVGNGEEMYAEVPFYAGQAEQDLVVPELSNWYDFDKNDSLKFFLPGSGQNSTLGIAYFNDDGSAWSAKDFEIAPSVLTSYYQGSYPGSISLSGWAMLSNVPASLQGYVLEQGTGAGGEQAELIPFLQPSADCYLPHVAITAPWSTNLVLINPNASAIGVNIQVIAGETRESKIIDLQAHQREELAINSSTFNLTDQDLDQAWLRIESDLPVAGYFSYDYNQESTASLPLFSQAAFSGVKYLPLCASNDFWWTGLAIFNPNDTTLELTATALDQDGQRVGQTIFQVQALSKKVMTLRGLFPENYQGIQTLVLEGNLDFSGLTLLGSLDGNRQLSGYVLQ